MVGWLAIGCGLLCLAAAPSPPPDPVFEKVKALSEALMAPDTTARDKAERELLAMGSPAIKPLVLLAARKDTLQRDAIRALLPRFGPEHVLDFARLHWAPDDPALEAVAHMGEPTLPEVLKLLERREGPLGPPPYRSFVIGVLGKAGAIDELVRLLKYPEHDVRAQAATLLANIADPRSADGLLEGLASGDMSVRGEAARGLGELQDRRAIEPLLRILREDPSVMTRRYAAGSLGKMYERRLLDPLVAVARRDRELFVRDQAGHALVNWSHHPVAIRLGRRYQPISIGPFEQIPNLTWHVLRLGATALLLYEVVFFGFRQEGRASWANLPRSAFWSALAIAAVGFYWGRLMTGMSARLEYALLLLCVPGTAWVAWAVGPTLRVVRRVAIVLGAGLALEYASNIIGGIPATATWLLMPYLMMAFLAFVLVASWWWRWKAEPDALARFRRATALGLAGFYVGYGIGWLALWGYFGV